MLMSRLIEGNAVGGMEGDKQKRGKIIDHRLHDVRQITGEESETIGIFFFHDKGLRVLQNNSL